MNLAAASSARPGFQASGLFDAVHPPAAGTHPAGQQSGGGHPDGYIDNHGPVEAVVAQDVG